MDVYNLIQKYKEEMSKPLTESNEAIRQAYDEGYIDGIVDLLGDLITFLEYSELNVFSEEMEDLQQKIYDKKVRNWWKVI